MASGSPTRLSPCRRCGAIGRESEMIPARDCDPRWKRGRVCEPCSWIILARRDGRRVTTTSPQSGGGRLSDPDGSGRKG